MTDSEMREDENRPLEAFMLMVRCNVKIDIDIKSSMAKEVSMRLPRGVFNEKEGTNHEAKDARKDRACLGWLDRRR
jgi:hypothetical protein